MTFLLEGKDSSPRISLRRNPTVDFESDLRRLCVLPSRFPSRPERETDPIESVGDTA